MICGGLAILFGEESHPVAPPFPRCLREGGSPEMSTPYTLLRAPPAVAGHSPSTLLSLRVALSHSSRNPQSHVTSDLAHRLTKRAKSLWRKQSVLGSDEPLSSLNPRFYPQVIEHHRLLRDFPLTRTFQRFGGGGGDTPEIQPIPKMELTRPGNLPSHPKKKPLITHPS